MARQFKAAVFDLDGTLLDTSEGLLASVKYTIDKMGLHPLNDELLRTFIGPPIQNSFERHYGLHGDILQDIADIFRDQYKNIDLLKAKPYKGIYNLFEELNKRKIKPVIATYKRQDYAIELLNHFHFDRYTNIMCGADNENQLKKKDIIKMALSKAGLREYSSALMVGDTDNDVIGANELDIKFIGVTYGFGFKSKDEIYRWQAFGAADTVEELKDIIIGGYTDEDEGSKIYI